MPIYEYECQSCRQIIEAQQSLVEPPLTTCPSCQGALCKIISQTSFQLKGGGWYADGYSGSSGKGKSCPANDSAPASPPPCANSCGCGCG